MTYKIAIIEDDLSLLKVIKFAFEKEGYKVYAFEDGKQAIDSLQNQKLDLAIIDIILPNFNGFRIFQEIRYLQNIPIIFLTSLIDEQHEISGLKLGAEDYIKKPISIHLLIERVRNVLNRYQNSITIPSQKAILKRGELWLDISKHHCFWKNIPIHLTATEFNILKSIIDFPGHVKSREQLISIAYDYNIHVDIRTIDSHVKRIRQKFKKIDPLFDKIETLYRIGYRYRDDIIDIIS